MFWAQIQANKRRTFVLFVVFLALVSLVAWSLEQLAGPGAALIALVIGLAQSIVALTASDKMALLAMGARDATAEESRHLLHTVEGLAIAAQIPTPRCMIVDDPSANAFATGLPHINPTVCVTSGLLEQLDRQELEGVIAHEIAHIGNHDTRVMTIAFVLVAVIALAAQFGMRMLYWGGMGRGRHIGSDGGRDRGSQKGNGAQAFLLIVAVIGILLAPLVARLLAMAVSRNREYLADAEAVRLTRNPQGLIGALEKISGTKDSQMDAQAARGRVAHQATAHLWFVHPIRQGFLASRWFSTHPPIEQRIKRLQSM